jgi:hypothetical protein
VRQPYAELIVAGAKWIETRPMRTNYRGRIAIHAGAADQDAVSARRDPMHSAAMDAVPHGAPLPLGAIVGSAEIVDCPPINPPGNSKIEIDAKEPAYLRFICRHIGDSLTFYEFDNGGDHAATRSDDITAQFPLGDFSDGRWAWILADAKPITERCPWCWGEGTEFACDPVDLEPDQSPPEAWGYPCRLCDGAAMCDPVPVKGQLGLWNWGGRR